MSGVAKKIVADCVFCKIVSGAIPSRRVAESAHALAFMDVNPLSPGHVLVIPKEHAEQMHEVSDEGLAELLPMAKSVVTRLKANPACAAANYNILQNNGRLAHQEVMHVHFHIIPRSESAGLGIDWKPCGMSGEQISAIHDTLN